MAIFTLRHAVFLYFGRVMKLSLKSGENKFKLNINVLILFFFVMQY